MRASFMRAMANQSTTKFLPDLEWFLGSLQYITNKFGDLTLQEPESCGIIRSGTDRLPPAPVRVGLINKAQLGHELSELGKMGSDPEGDKVNHILAASAAPRDPICLSPPEFDSEGGGEVYMVGNRDELPDKTVEEIQQETDIELACAAHLAREVERGKRHNGMQEDTAASKDEPGDGAPTRRHHLKFNSRCPVDRDQLRKLSQSICDKIDQIEYQGEHVYRTPA
jgi:hypothetical protein